MITEEHILEAQKKWGEGIINIGRVFLEKGDHKAAAEHHINTFYNYQEGKVLFKPTLASIKQFRLDFDAVYTGNATNDWSTGKNIDFGGVLA